VAVCQMQQHTDVSKFERLQLSHPHRAFHRAGQTYRAVARTRADVLARSRLHGELADRTGESRSSILWSWTCVWLPMRGRSGGCLELQGPVDLEEQDEACQR
jgi:hypothetical protein